MAATSNVTIEFEDGVLGYHFGTWGARGTRLKYSFHAHCEHGMLEIAGVGRIFGPGSSRDDIVEWVAELAGRARRAREEAMGLRR